MSPDRYYGRMNCQTSGRPRFEARPGALPAVRRVPGWSWEERGGGNPVGVARCGWGLLAGDRQDIDYFWVCPGLPVTNQIQIDLTKSTPDRPTARPSDPPAARAAPPGRASLAGVQSVLTVFWLDPFCLSEGRCSFGSRVLSR